MPAMDRSTFEAELLRDGYRIVVNTMQPGQVNPDHAHDFDARLLVVAGEMTVVVGDQRNTYRVGDTFSMTHGCRHAEHAGADGATYVAGRLAPAQA
jgi:quercetin dioxygenase-like cupin family protein